MKRKNNKGFTLIELLAVIVILGIILTIVVSNVVKYINDARKGSYKDTYSVIIKGIQTQLMANEMSNKTPILDECNDNTLGNECYNKEDYKGIYDKKNIELIVDKDTTSGNYNLIINPTSDGSFSSVALKVDDTPKGALLENKDNTKDTGNILTSIMGTDGQTTTPSVALSSGGKKVTTTAKAK